LVGAVIALSLLFVTEFVTKVTGSLTATILTVIILASASSLQKERGLLQSRWLKAIGDRSYSLYLFHWPAQLISVHYFDGTARKTLVSLSLTLALGMFSYRWIEGTTRNLWKALRLRTAIGLALASLVTLLTVTLLSYRNVENQTLNETQEERNERTAEELRILNSACSKEDSDVWVVGDSHLGAIITEISMLRQGDCRLFGNFGFGLENVVFQLAPVGVTATNQAAKGVSLRNLEDFITQVRLEKPRVIVMVYFLTQLMSNPDTAPPSSNWITVEWFDEAGARVSREQFLDLYEMTLRNLTGEVSNHGGIVVVASPPPDFDWLRQPNDSILDYNFEDLCGSIKVDAPTRRRISKECEIWRSEATKDLLSHQERIGEIHRLLDAIQESSSGFRHIALDVPFCNQQECRNYVRGTPAYLDDDHLNRAGATLAAERLSEVLQLDGVRE